MERLALQTKLKEFLGSNNVYFQPPASVKMHYPAIVYELDTIDIRSADDLNYVANKRYSITIIDSNPDTEYVDRFLDVFRGARFDRFFVSDNLNHFIFTIYW